MSYGSAPSDRLGGGMPMSCAKDWGLRNADIMVPPKRDGADE